VESSSALRGQHLAKTHDYQLIHGTESAVETVLAAQTEGGWQPILMSTATVNADRVGVIIVLERAIRSPYPK